MRGLARLAWLIGGLWLAQTSVAAAQSVFSDWSVVVVAGDWHAHSGQESEAFDNARRDVTQAFEQAGFSPANLRQFSVRPEKYKGVALEKSEPQAIFNALADLTARATGGCLIYFSSHGAPGGVLVDQQLLPPGVLAKMVDTTCDKRPTVVIISACFSGVFVPALQSPNRMILTAARPDRTSFGCGEADKYPYFDQCVLESMPYAKDFLTLGTTVQRCVAAREIKEGMSPPSEPQLYVGPALRPLLPFYSLAVASPRRN